MAYPMIMLCLGRYATDVERKGILKNIAKLRMDKNHTMEETNRKQLTMIRMAEQRQLTIIRLAELNHLDLSKNG